MADHLMGNTSACAEKSSPPTRSPRKKWKYLRVCGEEKQFLRVRGPLTEIPPRMRRRVLGERQHPLGLGNTSAYAEKSAPQGRACPYRWKYLRVCGEEFGTIIFMALVMEIPPRMRRRGSATCFTVSAIGNTSAYAEKRQSQPKSTNSNRKYLRVCGEERRALPPGTSPEEIPPRMRRRASRVEMPQALDGNTSAYAEKSVQQDWVAERERKYLRVCGEEMPVTVTTDRGEEIPPRMRRRAKMWEIRDCVGRNTSAYAEKRVPDLRFLRRSFFKSASFGR